MIRTSRTLRAAGLWAVLAGAVPGCNTGGGVPQMLEPTKPRMDREKETDTPAPRAENKKAFGSQ